MPEVLPRIIAEIDAEIARLQQARELLTGVAAPKKRGRPSKKTVSADPVVASRERKPMSAEARKRIGEAQRKRWASTKKSAKSSKGNT